MPEAATMTQSLNARMNAFTAATKTSRDEAQRAWAQGCDLYARYFNALAQAKGPEGLFAANADFMTGSMEALTKSANAARRFSSAA